MKTKLNMAVIGLGKQAKSSYIPYVNLFEYANLVAICDHNKETLKHTVVDSNISKYTSYQELLDNEQLDFLVITTPHDTHFDIVKKSAERGVHIFKEKPVCKNFKQACELVELLNTYPVHVKIGMQRRFFESYLSLCNLISSMQQPFFVEAKSTLCIPDPHAGWRGSSQIAGGGCILDMGYHLIDLIIWYFGLPDKVYANYSSRANPNETYDAEDTACISFAYEKGLHGNLILSRCYPPKMEKIVVIGSQETIEAYKDKIKVYNNETQQVAETSFSDSLFNLRQIDAFCETVLNSTSILNEVEQHLHHLAFIEACYQSQNQYAVINPWDVLEIQSHNKPAFF